MHSLKSWQSVNMSEKILSICNQQIKPIKIKKWKVNAGVSVPVGCILLLYDFTDSGLAQNRKLKSSTAGIVHKILVKEGDVVNKGEIIMELVSCPHPTIMNDMCAECGADLRKDDIIGTASVPMIHAIPDLKVSEELAQKLGKADNERLISDRKLVLLVDLDQTLIHTTNDNIPPNIKDVYHFQLYGPTSPWYHTRLRPGTHQFLNKIHSLYELHICTFGARNYAHTIATFLDVDQKIFSNRILSRDECFDPTSKKANLKALFPCGDNMVCIIDDREDVWSHATNLIHVKPYHFFQHTGDINAPPGLDKHEQDEKVGIDLTNLTDKNNKCQDAEVDSVNEEVTSGDQKGEDKEETIPVQKLTEKTCDDNINKEVVEEEAKIVEESHIEPSKIEEISTVIVENTEQQTDSNQRENSNHSNSCDSAKVSTKPCNPNDKLSSIKDIAKSDIKNSESEKKLENNMMVVEDPDDYLIYLEDILNRIHKEFYEKYDKMESGEIPDLKNVIPKVRSQILQNCKLVFSGLVPTRTKLEHSKAYQVARGLGAIVTQDLEDTTTHLVAVRPGTVKVNAGRKKKNLKIVTPDWLWCCAERWEHVDERIFPLRRKGSKNRHPPPHCSSPQHIPEYPEHNKPAARRRTPSGRFMDTINPLMSFSSDDIANMDKEVEATLGNESDTSDQGEDDFDPEENQNGNDVHVAEILNDSITSSSSEDSLTGDYPKGFKRKRHCADSTNVIDELYNSTEDESPSVKFRRGESVDDDMVDMEPEETQESEGSLDPPDEVDDGEWNMMGAALEREFLANN